MTPFRLAVVLVCLLGIPVGIGAFTFVYAKGFSYLSTDPRACVECHLPDRGLAKWVAKADHGFRHSMAFTLQNFKEPIEITPGDREIVRANCLRCPAAFVHAVAATPVGQELDCLHCHAGAGHGAGG